MASDEELIRWARVGDEMAFRELWRRHSAALLDIARAVDGPAVHDILTEAYLDASRRIAWFEGGPIRRWLEGIVKARVSASAAIAAEMQAASREAMAQLPQRQREVLRLVHEEKLAPEDAAVRMGVKPDEVRELFDRAFARFAELVRRRRA